MSAPAVARFASASLAISVLAGCTVGPDYGGPPPIAPVSIASSQFRRAQGIDVTAAVPSARWWEGLGDSTLSSLIDKALASSPDVEIAEFRVRRARALVREQRANELPSISASALALRADLPAGSLGLPVTQGQSQSDRTEAEFYNVGFDASWEIDLFGGKRRSVEGARARADATDADLNDAKVRLSAEVAQTYIDLRDRQQRLILARSSAALEARSLALVEQRKSRGASSAQDVAQIRTQVQAANANIMPLEGQVAESLDQLALLSGDEPGALDAVLVVPGPVPSPPIIVDAGDPAAMLRRRPDIRAAERRLTASNADIGVSVAQMFPSISLMGVIGLGGPAIGDTVDPGNISSILLPRLNWNFLDFGRNRAKVRQSEAARDEAQAQYRKSVLSALNDAETSLTRFGHLRRNVAALQVALQSAKEDATLAGERYRGGTIPLMTALDAERRNIDAQNALLQSSSALTKAFVALQKSLGLGWQGEVASELKP